MKEVKLKKYQAIIGIRDINNDEHIEDVRIEDILAFNKFEAILIAYTLKRALSREVYKENLLVVEYMQEIDEPGEVHLSKEELRRIFLNLPLDESLSEDEKALQCV